MIAKVWIHGIINENSLKTMIDDLKKFPSYDEIEVNINSFGGYVYEGVNLYKFLMSEKERGIKITSVGWGLVLSSATLPFMAGDIRRLTNSTKFLIHLPMTGDVSGLNQLELESYTNDLKEDTNESISIYKSVTGIDEGELFSLMSENRYWSNEETLSRGFATEIKNYSDAPEKAKMYSGRSAVYMCKKDVINIADFEEVISKDDAVTDYFDELMSDIFGENIFY